MNGRPRWSLSSFHIRHSLSFLFDIFAESAKNPQQAIKSFIGAFIPSLLLSEPIFLLNIEEFFFSTTFLQIWFFTPGLKAEFKIFKCKLKL